jgi:hypothetical protein
MTHVHFTGPARISRFAGLAAVVALALAACSPATDPEVTPSGSPEPTASASVTAAPPHEIVTGDDVAVLARLEAPTTGETWHAPVAIDNLGLLAYPDYGIEDDYRYYEVGARGDATIVVAVPAYFDYYSGGFTVYAMFEITDAGARMITCPSARLLDSCLDWSTDWELPGRSLDNTTRYDSLTYPVEVQPVAGWVLKTARLAGSDWVSQAHAFGDANAFPGITLSPEDIDYLGRSDRREIVALGDSILVEYRGEADVTGLVDSRFGIETPYGAFIPSESAMTSQWYGEGAVTWDDGVETFTHPSPWDDEPIAWPVVSASLACFGPDETLATAFNPSQWEQAGTHRLGGDVYLPVSGGNAVSAAVWQTMKDNSWGADIEPALEYPYATVDAFLEARSVFAWERPDGEWVIAMDGFAGQRVYECA